MATVEQESIFEVRVCVPREQVDAISDYIVEQISSGLILEEEDDCPKTTILFYAAPDVAEAQVAMVRGYLVHLLGGEIDPNKLVTATEIKNRAWEEEYRRSVRPVEIGDAVVRPPWAPSPSQRRYEIVIEPKMAFGTGTHETTRSCMRVIQKEFIKGMRFLDLGCGSGILSILVDKMGASYIKAIDYDVTAIDNCRENFDRNEVSAPHDVLFGSIEKCREDAPYQFIVANIIKSTILEMLPRLLTLTARPGKLVLSGLLMQDMPDIEEALKDLGVAGWSVLPDNEWRTYTIELG